MNKKIHKNTIMIAAGGTGGHIFPSLSIINQIQNHLFIIITDERGEDYFNMGKILVSKYHKYWKC